ncbi:hypothetical protein ACFYMO_09010 [Streptomyces sp. NPDC007025]|uniref:hypothetical protein n=1 Tax=Streptomyces sp. NPDC007025 TaxID=3364771 RepID=UPI0036BC84A8
MVNFDSGGASSTCTRTCTQRTARSTERDQQHARKTPGQHQHHSRRPPVGRLAGVGTAPSPQPEERVDSRLWHVTLNVAGRDAPLGDVRRALERLAHDHPFLLTSRYADDHAEIRYWEEAQDLHDAAAVALRLWGEHRSSAGLPPWEIVGLEVIGRETYRRRVAEGCGPPPVSTVGVHPF